MLKKSLLSFSIFIAFSASASAEETSTQPEVLVTATRRAETVDSTLASVSVITRAEIDASGAQDVIELLRLTPGVDVARSGGPGQATSLFLRGTNSNHVLVLVDGVRVASANSGALAFEELPLDAIERIEIVRGPRASVWGSDAIGGVIQVFTRRLTGPRLAASYGSYHTTDGSAGYGTWNGGDGFSLQVGARHTRGFSAQNESGYSFDADLDGHQNHNIAARGAVTIGSQTLSANLLRNQGSVDFDQGHSRMIDQAQSINLAGPLSDSWSHRLTVGGERGDLNTPDFFSLFTTRRQSIDWQNEITLSTTQHVVAGVDFVHEEGESRDTFSDLPQYRDQRDNSAVYGLWHADAGALNGEISARYDHNSEFGSTVTGSAAIGWQFADAWRGVASFGQGFRAPNLNEQFSPGYGGLFAGNPDLDPERSHSAELGLDWHPDAAKRIGVRAFSTRIHDLISFSGGDTFRAENISRAKIDGSELQYTAHAAQWSFDASYTWQNPKNVDNDTLLLRRPKQKLVGVLDRRFGECISAGVEVEWSGSRKDVGDVNLSSFTLVDFHASYTINSDWRLGLRLENLLDRDYELVSGFNTPGRSGFLQLIWAPH